MYFLFIVFFYLSYRIMIVLEFVPWGVLILPNRNDYRKPVESLHSILERFRGFRELLRCIGKTWVHGLGNWKWTLHKPTRYMLYDMIYLGDITPT